ncbi:MAG: hypothetical protein ACYSX1_13330 [Planctomycetota bacterium]|jgi:hypothetical protein
MQILIFVIVGVIYALNAILKAKSGKTQQKDVKQRPARPQRKPSQTMTQAQRQPAAQPRRPARPTEPISQPQPPKRKLARPVPVPQPTAPQPLQAAQIPQPDIEQLPQYTTQTLKKLKKLQTKHLTRTPERPKAQPPEDSASVLDIADADELRRAILHYEILGRPLSLRDPSQRMFAL